LCRVGRRGEEGRERERERGDGGVWGVGVVMGGKKRVGMGGASLRKR